jgi:hypothetical protein
MTIGLFDKDAENINFNSIKHMPGAAGGDRTHVYCPLEHRFENTIMYQAFVPMTLA